MYKTNLTKLIFTFIFFLFCAVTIFSQNFDTQLNIDDTTQVHILLLKDGKKLKGHITSIKNEEVFFSISKNQRDTVFTLSDIKNIRVKDNLDWNNTTYDSPLNYVDYLFFVNTAFNLKKGDRMYRTFMGASVMRQQALDKGLTVGLSFSFPLFISANIKLGGTFSSTKKSHLGFKSTFLFLPVGDRFSIFENSLMWTLGTPDRFLNMAFTNYFISQNDFFSNYFPTMYHSVSVGGGIRMNKNWQLILENRVNFNDVFIDAKILPSFGLSYSTPRFNFSFGFHSANQRGFNLFPIMDFNDDNITTFERSILSRFPYFSYAKIF